MSPGTQTEQNMAKEAPKKADDTAAAAKPKGKGKKLILIVVTAVAVIAIGAGAALFLLGGQGGDEHKEAKAKPNKAPLFVNLEPFTVNLQPENGEQYLQVVATLKIADKDVGEQIKVYMPELRHRILLLLSGKKASEIATPEGREALAEEIRSDSNRILDPSAGKPVKTVATSKPIGKVATKATAEDGPVTGVLFTSFIVQ
jgi:flagellar FliL protein